jgi:hypothetical protein
LRCHAGEASEMYWANRFIEKVCTHACLHVYTVIYTRPHRVGIRTSGTVNRFGGCAWTRVVRTHPYK